MCDQVFRDGSPRIRFAWDEVHARIFRRDISQGQPCRRVFWGAIGAKGSGDVGWLTISMRRKSASGHNHCPGSASEQSNVNDGMYGNAPGPTMFRIDHDGKGVEIGQVSRDGSHEWGHKLTLHLPHFVINQKKS